MTRIDRFFKSHAPVTVAAKASADVRIANPDGPRELIMVVDDEDFVTMLAEQVLTDQGYRVVTARDGFQAVDIFRKIHAQVELVILDFVMPVMDGAAVFKELRKTSPRLPVVITSGFTPKDKLEAILADGFSGFFPKPLTRNKLLPIVRSTLDGMRTR